MLRWFQQTISQSIKFLNMYDFAIWNLFSQLLMQIFHLVFHFTQYRHRFMSSAVRDPSTPEVQEVGAVLMIKSMPEGCKSRSIVGDLIKVTSHSSGLCQGTNIRLPGSGTQTLPWSAFFPVRVGTPCWCETIHCACHKEDSIAYMVSSQHSIDSVLKCLLTHRRSGRKVY